MAIARDKFWLFGVRAHQDDMLFGFAHRNDSKRPYNWSRITPTEGAHILDIPNMIMVACDGDPAPFSHEAYGYMESFYNMKNVIWSSTGSNGFRAGNEEEFICDLAHKYPNVRGAYLDDICRRFNKLYTDPEEAQHQAKEFLDGIKEKLKKADREMELWMVLYNDEKIMDPHVFDAVTGITFWTHGSEAINDLEENFENMEKVFPDKKKYLGIYMYDFHGMKYITEDLMKHQCDHGLKLLKEKRIEGMIFESNSTMGVRFPSELFLRKWIEENKYTQIPD